MKDKSINKICFQAAFWPSMFIVGLSILFSTIAFKQHMHDVYERELNRHELIFQLISKAVVGDIIIQNDHALYVTLNDFKTKYKLEDLRLTNKRKTSAKPKADQLIMRQAINSSWEIAGLFPQQYITIGSIIEPRTILMPVALSLGIILLFVIASIIMYQRIKKQLQIRIVEPLQHTLQQNKNNKSRFNFNHAATEITDLYNRTQSFIKTLHNQRDTIEKNKIEAAQYHMALQVAHDIRSPALALETISALSSELKEENKNLINKVTKRIIQIADNILKTHTPHSASLAIGHIIENLVTEKKIYCNKLNIAFSLSLDPISYHTHLPLSEEQLNRVLSNLIDNAIEAIDQKGTIQIITEIKQSTFYLSLTDTGCGISEQKMKHLFEKTFFSSKSKGHGLGLPYVKQLIENHGGKIHAQSNVGKGTRFDIEFPVSEQKDK